MMAKINAYILLLLLFSGKTLVSQHKQISLCSAVVYSSTTNNSLTQKTATLTIDTIKPATFAMTCYTANPSALVLYYADVKAPHDSGYVTGTNVYGDLEKAQHFINATTTTLTGCAIKMRTAFSSTSTTIGTKVKLYSYSGTAPSTVVIATSNLVPQNTINNNGFTVFTFSTPVVVTSDFVMSVLLPNHIGDTTAIYSTLTACNSGQSLSWERASDNSWGSIHTNWNFSTTQNIDLAIFPLKQVAVTTAITETRKTPTWAIYPNPMHDRVTIINQINPENNSRFRVENTQGQTIFEGTLDKNSSINCSDWPQGMYVISIIDEQAVFNFKCVKF